MTGPLPDTSGPDGPAGAPATASGPPLFASGADDRRARRPTDVALAAASAIAILICSVVSRVAADLDTALSEAAGRFPAFLDPLWRGLVVATAAWAVFVLGAALVRRRPAMARDMAAAVVAALAVAAALGAAVTGADSEVVRRLADLDGPPTFPTAALVATVAALAVASPHLARPFRNVGRWLVAGQTVAAVFLGMATVAGATAAVLAGVLAAAGVHLLVGSPGGRPTVSRIEAAVAELGVDVVELEPARMQLEGVVRFAGTDREGPIDVKVYGRDAWDAQVLTAVWRFAWYRGTSRTPRFSRLSLIEHEAFVTLMAERAGVRVPHVVTAGSAGQGDALIVVRPDGEPLATAQVDVGDDGLDALWRDLRRLHHAGIAHQRLEPSRVRVHDDGTLGLGDLSSAVVITEAADRLRDHAQAIALGIVLAGEQRSVAMAARHLDDALLLDVVPYLQAAALPATVRDALDALDVDLDDVRNRIRASLGAREQQLVRLRRVTAGSLLNMSLLAIAAWMLISAFGGMDLEEFAAEIREASWWWLAFALVFAQLPRVPSAWSTMGSVATPLPAGPVTALQYAISYVNMAIPSTAARVAINVRFFQRFGVRPTEAVTAGVIDAVSGFVVQVIILVTVFFFASDLDLDLEIETSTFDGVSTIVLVVVAALVIAVVAIVTLVPAVRRRIAEQLRTARAALGVLRSPGKLAMLFGGNTLSQVLFAVALGACVLAFGHDLPLSQLLLINTVVSLFAGLLPVPGGIGVSEAGLAFGLNAAGIPAETAFAIALAYRFTTFYLPPIWGWVAYRWLLARRYL